MALRDIIAAFRITVEDSRLKQAERLVDGFSEKLSGVGQAIAGAFAFGAIKNSVGQFIDQADALNDTATRLGLSTDALQRWQLAAELGGASADDVANAFKFLGKNAGNALGGGGPAKDFAKLGLSLRGANGEVKSTDVLMREAGIAIAGLGSPAEKSAAALAIFGKAGDKMIGVFGEGAADIDKAIGALDELGGGFSGDAIKNAAEYNDQLAMTRVAWVSLQSKVIGPILLPMIRHLKSLTSAVANLSKNPLFEWFRKNVDTSNLLLAAFITLTAASVAFGSASLVAGGKAFLAWARVAAPLILITLLVDDLIKFFKGDGATATEDFITALAGNDAAEVIQFIRDAWREFVEDLSSAPGILDKVLATVTAISDRVEQAMTVVGAVLSSAAGFKIDPAEAVRQLKEAKAGVGVSTPESRKAERDFPGQIEAMTGHILAMVNSLPVQAAISPLGPGDFGPKGIVMPAPPPAPKIINQSVTVTQHIGGADAATIAGQSVSGVKGALGDANRAALNALEDRKR